MGLLFVPLTTITNDPIPKHEIGNAASLFNLMRNIGASIGIASVIATFSRHTQQHTSDLSANVNNFNPAARATFEAMRNGLMARGMDMASATKQAYAGMFGLVERHAAMLSYIDAFFLLAALFVLVLPLVLLMKKPTKQGKPAEAMAH